VGTFADWLVHTVEVETLSGGDEYGGQTFEAAREVACWIEDRVVLRRGTGEHEVVVGTLIHFEDLSQAAWFEIGSKVTVNGRTVEVVTRSVVDSKGAWSSLEGVTVGLA
jgi:hypothetical protein